MSAPRTSLKIGLLVSVGFLCGLWRVTQSVATLRTGGVFAPLVDSPIPTALGQVPVWGLVLLLACTVGLTYGVGESTGVFAVVAAFVSGALTASRPWVSFGSLLLALALAFLVPYVLGVSNWQPGDTLGWR